MTIFILDQDPLFSELLKEKLIQKGVDEVYTFDFFSDAIAMLEKQPDFIVLNHAINGLFAIDFLEMLKQRLPGVELIYLGPADDIDILARVKQVGNSHYINRKPDVQEAIIRYIFTTKIAVSTRSRKKIFSFKNKCRKRANPLIFLLDDDRLFLTFIKHRLSKIHGLRIRTFEEPSFLYAALDENPDLLVLDYYLHNETGDMVLQKVKEIAPETRIVMLTSQQNFDTAQSLFEAGIVDYVVKNTHWEKNLHRVLKKRLNLAIDID